jgi:hypothetical protein
VTAASTSIAPCAAIQDAQGRFRRLRGSRDLAGLIRALDRTAMDSRKEVA